MSVNADGSVRFDSASAVANAKQASATDDAIAVLEDGNLTFAEYEQQMKATIACARANGSQVVDQGVENVDGVQIIQVAIPTDGTEEAYDDCYDQHVAAADYIWQVGHQKPDTRAEGQLLTDQQEALVDCVVEHSSTPIDAEAVKRGDIEFQEVVDIADKIEYDCYAEAGIG